MNQCADPASFHLLGAIHESGKNGFDLREERDNRCRQAFSERSQRHASSPRLGRHLLNLLAAMDHSHVPHLLENAFESCEIHRFLLPCRCLENALQTTHKACHFRADGMGQSFGYGDVLEVVQVHLRLDSDRAGRRRRLHGVQRILCQRQKALPRLCGLLERD